VTSHATGRWRTGARRTPVRQRAALVLAAALTAAVPAAAEDPASTAVTSAVRPLRQLAAEASVIALAVATRTEVFDEGRLHVHRLHVERVLRGRLDEPEPGVVDVRGDSKRPPLFADGERMIVLLRPSAPLSYLKEHLPPGLTPFTPVAGRVGVLPVGGAAEVDAIERALTDGAALRPEDEAGRRRLAFAELAGPSSALAGDAVAELRLLPQLAPFAPSEVGILSRTLANQRIDRHTRVDLLGLIGQRGDTTAQPALAATAVDAPPVLDALLAARSRLGSPASRAELDRYLSGRDAALRTAAIRGLAYVPEPGAVTELGRYATTDPDLAVRTAAIEALGQSHKADALSVLAKTFADPAREVKQKSAQAIVEIGGPAADATLTELALQGDSIDSKKYAALLLLVTHGRDDPVVKGLLASNPSPEVRHLLEHGVEFHDSHKHE